jgi:hypothetical protein
LVRVVELRDFGGDKTKFGKGESEDEGLVILLFAGEEAMDDDFSSVSLGFDDMNALSNLPIYADIRDDNGEMESC